MSWNVKLKNWLDRPIDKSGIFASIAVFTAIATAVTALGIDKYVDNTVFPEVSMATRTSELEDIRGRIDAMAELNRTSSLQNNGPITDIEAVRIRNEISNISLRIKRLEDAISNDPKRALEVPLMRRDLDNMEKSQIQSIASVKQVVDSVYDLTKWVLGGTVFSVIAVAISNYFSTRNKNKDGSKSNE